MDRVYRVFQKGEDPADGEVVKAIGLKSIITEPTGADDIEPGTVAIRGAAYAGEASIVKVEVSVDGGSQWHHAEFIGPNEPFAWRRWQYLWQAEKPGEYTIMCRAFDSDGEAQPQNAGWNKQGYGNNGISEHAVKVQINA